MRGGLTAIPARTTNASIPTEIQRAIRRLESSINEIVAKQDQQAQALDGKLGQGDLSNLALFVRNQLQANGSAPLSITGLTGVAAQAQPASVPTYSSLPSKAPQNSVALVNGQLYQYSAAQGTPVATWKPVGSSIYLDTHANRVTNYPASSYPVGTLFFETDLNALYVDTGSGWTQVAGGGGSGAASLIEVNGQPVGQAGLAANGLVIGFLIGAGIAGSNVGPMLPAPHLGALSQCVVVVKSSDPGIALQFMVRKNGTAIFTAPIMVAAGTAAGTSNSFTNFTSTPLNAAQNDVFTIDILSGSSAWQFSAQLE